MVTNYYGTEKYFATIDLVSEYAAIIDCEENRSNIFDEPTINRVIFVMKYIYKQVGGQDTDPPEPSNERLPRYAQGGRLRTLESNCESKC